MNVDENPVTSAVNRVTGLPILDVYRDSQLVRSIRGARPKAALETELADLQDDSTLS